jgi:hypothetical protein
MSSGGGRGKKRGKRRKENTRKRVECKLRKKYLPTYSNI